MERFNAPPGGWGAVVRGPDGRFQKFPGHVSGSEESTKRQARIWLELVRLANSLHDKGFTKEAEQVDQLTEDLTKGLVK